jgi:hypothetical protein
MQGSAAVTGVTDSKPPFPEIIYKNHPPLLPNIKNAVKLPVTAVTL